MIRRAHNQQHDPRWDFRINERIQASELRVLDYENKQIGVMSKLEALNLARQQELDLVEVAPAAKPPVAKIIDFNKFLYQQAKRKQEEKKKTKTTETKEVRFGPHIQDNDLHTAVDKIRGFLDEGNKVRLVVKFKGRQIIHPEFGHNVLKRVTDILADVSKVDKEPNLMGKQLMMVISPDKKTKKIEGETTHAEKEN